MRNAITKPISAMIIVNRNTFCDPAVIAFAISACLAGAEVPCKYFSIPPVRILIATAVPIAPTTCCSVFMTAVPCGYNSGGN